jgi:hypothetical protein
MDRLWYRTLSLFNVQHSRFPDFALFPLPFDYHFSIFPLYLPSAVSDSRFMIYAFHLRFGSSPMLVFPV